MQSQTACQRDDDQRQTQDHGEAEGERAGVEEDGVVAEADGRIDYSSMWRFQLKGFFSIYTLQGRTCMLMHDFS